MTLLLLSALFLLMRLAILMFSPDNIYSDADELSRGALAKEIIEGPMLPILDYPEADSEVYEGGRLLASFIAAPLFLAFGDSYFSLKLAAVVCSLACLILWFILLTRIFNRRAAVIWSLLFILSPPLYTQASLVTWGAHAEYYFFTPLFLIFLQKILSGKHPDEAKGRLWVAFGFFSGLSIWIIQNNIIVLVTCFFAIFILDRRFFFKKPFGIYLFSFFAGYSPGIYHYFSRHWQYSIPCDSIFKLYPRSGASNWLPKLKGLIIKHLPRSFFFKPEGLSFVYFSVFMLAFLYIIWLNRRPLRKIWVSLFTFNPGITSPGDLPPELPFLLYFPAYLLAYTFGGLGVWEDDQGYLKYKYLTIIYPLIFFVLSVALDKLWENKRGLIAVPISGFLLLAGLGANIKLISFKDFGSLRRQAGFSYYELGDRISGGRTIQGIKAVLVHLRRVNPGYGPDFLSGIAAGMAFNRAINKDVEGILSVFSGFRPEYQSYLYKGWGIGLNDIFLEDQAAGMKRLEIISSRIEDKYKKYLYSGLGQGIMTNFVEAYDAESVLLLISREIEPSYLKDFYAGVSKGLLNFDQKEREGLIASCIAAEYRHFLSDNHNF